MFAGLSRRVLPVARGRCTMCTAQQQQRPHPSKDNLPFLVKYVIVSGAVWSVGVRLDFFVGPYELLDTFVILPFSVYRRKWQEDAMGSGAALPEAPAAGAGAGAEAASSSSSSAVDAPRQEQLKLLRLLEQDVIAHPVAHGSREECVAKLRDIVVQKRRLKDELKAGMV